MKNFKYDWSIKNPKFNLSKDDIRNTVKDVFKEYNFGDIFGTPEDWDFDSYNMDIEISNASVNHINDKTFIKAIDKVVNNFITLFNRNITYSLQNKSKNYSEHNFNIDYGSIILKLKISKNK